MSGCAAAHWKTVKKMNNVNRETVFFHSYSMLTGVRPINFHFDSLYQLLSSSFSVQFCFYFVCERSLVVKSSSFPAAFVVLLHSF